jgi:hypothetical protein
MKQELILPPPSPPCTHSFVIKLNISGISISHANGEEPSTAAEVLIDPRDLKLEFKPTQLNSARLTRIGKSHEVVDSELFAPDCRLRIFRGVGFGQGGGSTNT